MYLAQIQYYIWRKINTTLGANLILHLAQNRYYIWLKFDATLGMILITCHV